ncbi:hypothetical protein [Candidatus Tisiphia endosymbiont of Nemotelus uliginosus]|uniref:hypothetical protein n=1 Tax=Candidatus Tisiphia endosymbiont of Nemotelus uliginosus TaxID=3077926 RepID=UPI0035C8F955
MNYWEGGFNSQRLDSPRVTDNKNIVQNDVRYQEREFEAPSTVANITNLIQQDKSADNTGKPTEQESSKEVLSSSSPIACSSLLLTTSTPSSQDVLIGASRRKRSMHTLPLYLQVLTVGSEM